MTSYFFLCKALNLRLLSFLRFRTTYEKVETLIGLRDGQDKLTICGNNHVQVLLADILAVFQRSKSCTVRKPTRVKNNKRRKKFSRRNENISRRNEKFSRYNEKFSRTNEKNSRSNENISRNNEKNSRRNEKLSHNNEKISRRNENISRSNEKSSRRNEKNSRRNEKNSRTNEKLSKQKKCDLFTSVNYVNRSLSLLNRIKLSLRYKAIVIIVRYYKAGRMWYCNLRFPPRAPTTKENYTASFLILLSKKHCAG